MIITIDGPASSGKSSVARVMAHTLHFYYINSGMLYRAFGYCLLTYAKIDVEHLKTVTIETRKQYLQMLRYEYDIDSGVVGIYYEMNNITDCLKTPLLDKAASYVGQNNYAREFLTHLQRRLADAHDLIAEGRDAGSNVFSHADVKFFLTATPEVRATRWLHDQEKAGNIVTDNEALRMINERDKRDITRPHAPLCIHKDNIIVDNSEKSIEQTVAFMLDIVNSRKRK